MIGCSITKRSAVAPVRVPVFDGADAVHTHMTNSRMTDVEVFEQNFPVIVESFSVRKIPAAKANGVVAMARFAG